MRENMRETHERNIREQCANHLLEKKREKELAEQREARRIKAAEKKEKRNHRKAVQLGIAEDVPKPAKADQAK